ncbi:unnamed protein product [Sphenostylis stenocarpa]|uniref:Uncharacterized protein n=1 Tax=Sphenostylis stenocarpa TaxID=92480 RepID=A0AA86S3W5_9FABA|nr:unnamed protein product [Sphenostylis stenocarpa]
MEDSRVGTMDLHECADKLLQLPITQQALARECSNKCVDELLDGSVKILDICGTIKDCLRQQKESMNELESAIRRRRDAEAGFTIESGRYLSSRKQIKKAIRKALDLHDYAAKLLQLPTTQQAFALEYSDKCVDVLLERSLRLLDICSTAQDCLLQSKESIHMVQSVIRRKGADTGFTVEGGKYLAYRKRMEKFPVLRAVAVLYNSSSITATDLYDSSYGTGDLNLRQKLTDLQTLHDCIEKLVLLPLTQEVLVQERQEKWVDELLDGSLSVLDVCTAAKDALLHTKECARELQSIMRRKRGGEMEVSAELIWLSDKISMLWEEVTNEQQVLARECNDKWVDDLLEGFLRLLDICGAAKYWLRQSEDIMCDLKSVIPRKKASDSSEGNEVSEQVCGFAELAWSLPQAGLPTPSWELNHGNCAKALISWFLDKRAPRQAGFTEQRIPLALDSGGITGCCTSNPLAWRTVRRHWSRGSQTEAPREAGYTVQRTPLALDSGGITGCCTSNPMSLYWGTNSFAKAIEKWPSVVLYNLFRTIHND